MGNSFSCANGVPRPFRISRARSFGIFKRKKKVTSNVAQVDATASSPVIRDEKNPATTTTSVEPARPDNGDDTLKESASVTVTSHSDGAPQRLLLEGSGAMHLGASLTVADVAHGVGMVLTPIVGLSDAFPPLKVVATALKLISEYIEVGGVDTCPLLHELKFLPDGGEKQEDCERSPHTNQRTLRGVSNAAG